MCIALLLLLFCAAVVEFCLVLLFVGDAKLGYSRRQKCQRQRLNDTDMYTKTLEKHVHTHVFSYRACGLTAIVFHQ
jgi:hypothetical protein